MMFNVDLPIRKLENEICEERNLGNYMIMSEGQLASVTFDYQELPFSSEQV